MRKVTTIVSGVLHSNVIHRGVVVTQTCYLLALVSAGHEIAIVAEVVAIAFVIIDSARS